MDKGGSTWTRRRGAVDNPEEMALSASAMRGILTKPAGHRASPPAYNRPPCHQGAATRSPRPLSARAHAAPNPLRCSAGGCSRDLGPAAGGGAELHLLAAPRESQQQAPLGEFIHEAHGLAAEPLQQLDDLSPRPLPTGRGRIRLNPLDS